MKNDNTKTDNPKLDYVNQLNVNSSTDSKTNSNPYLAEEEQKRLTTEELEKDIPNLNQGISANIGKKGFFIFCVLIFLVMIILFYFFSSEKKPLDGIKV